MMLTRPSGLAAVWHRTGRLLLALQPLEALNQLMPAVDEIDAKHAHVQVVHSIANRRGVAGCQHQVVVDLIPECEPNGEFVQLLPRETADRRFAPVVVDRIEGTPESLGEVARQVSLQLKQWVVLRGLADEV